MESFAKWVRNNNRVDRNKLILTFFSYACFYFCFVLMSGDRGMDYWFAGTGIAIIAVIEIGRYLWNRYLYTCDNTLFFNDKKSISEVLWFHAFPVEAYFKVVRRKMIVPAVITGIYTLFMGVLGAWAEEMKYTWWKTACIILTVFICAICPLAVGFWKKRIFKRQLELGSESWWKTIFKIVKILFQVIEVMFIVIITPVSLFFLWAIISELIAPAVEQTAVVFRNYNGGMSIIFVFIAVGAVYACLCGAGGHKKGVARTLCTISAVSIIIAGVLIVYDSHVYTEFADDQVIVYHFGVQEIYDMKDIKNFRVYEENEAIQMELSFKDGVTERMIGNVQTYSDLYEEKYNSEYEFIADYVTKLQRAGVDGEVETVFDFND